MVMDTLHAADSRAALMALETAAATTRAGFACNFSSAAEYEQALIAARRAAGRYRQVSRWPQVLLACGVAVLAAFGLWALMAR
jgi:hypothetical protein